MLDPLYQYLLRFIDLTPEEFSFIVLYAEIRHFNKKVRLINIGETERYVNFINKGLVRKFFYRNREEVITQIAKENELICSSVSFFSGTPSDYVVETIEPTTVVSIARDNIEKIYEMNFKMERMGRLVTTDWLLQKEHWENSRIKERPKERFLNFINNNPDLLIRVPQKYLASYLNIKPETFSRYKRLLIQGPPTREPKALKPVIQQ
jgi:CRP-like cAMP-binding protein